LVVKDNVNSHPIRIIVNSYTSAADQLSANVQIAYIQTPFYERISEFELTCFIIRVKAVKLISIRHLTAACAGMTGGAGVTALETAALLSEFGH